MEAYKLTETGRLACLSAAKRNAERQKAEKRNRIEDYAKNPKICPQCHGPILPYSKRTNTFCSSACAAVITNKTRIRQRKTNPCNQCGKIMVGRTQKKFCSMECHKKCLHKRAVDKIESGTYKSSFSGNKMLKRYLIENKGNKCEKCNNSKWMGENIPLNVHHEDGDATNNKPENLKLLCLNCHGLTKNFGRKNKSTRTYRYAKSMQALIVSPLW